MKTILIVLCLLSALNSQPLRTSPRIVPEEINVQLCTTVFEAMRIPVINLYLETPTAGSIWISENLFVDVYFIDNKLFLWIRGYDQVADRDTCGKDDRLIIGGLKITYRNILIFPSYFVNDSLDIRIRLNGLENHLILLKENLECKILPISVHNIRLDPKYISRILYPHDVYNLYLSGKVNSDYNYLDELLKFAKDKKIRIANSKYSQIEIGNGQNIFVVLSESELTKLLSNGANNLPGHEHIQVNVKLIRDSCYR